MATSFVVAAIMITLLGKVMATSFVVAAIMITASKMKESKWANLITDRECLNYQLNCGGL